jgi:hypothetical protein
MTIPHSIGKWIPSLKKTWASSFSRTPSKDFKKTDTSNAMLSGWLKWWWFVPQWSGSGMAQTTTTLAGPLEHFVRAFYH